MDCDVCNGIDPDCANCELQAIPGVSFTRITLGTRIDITCDKCKQGINTSAESHIGQHLAATWPTVHKCPKGATL